MSFLAWRLLITGLTMSIAVSALVRPSRIQRLVWGGCGLAHCASALAVGLLAPEQFLLAPLLALVLAGAGACVLGAAARRPKAHRIDISGTGDLRVTVQQDVDGRDRAAQEGACWLCGATASSPRPGARWRSRWRWPAAVRMRAKDAKTRRTHCSGPTLKETPPAGRAIPHNRDAAAANGALQ